MVRITQIQFTLCNGRLMTKSTPEKNSLVYRTKSNIYRSLTNPNATKHHPPLELQEYFREQRSLVQEVIEAAGHLYLFLPKFHYELNYMGDGVKVSS